MKTVKLEQWNICIDDNHKTIKEDNKLAIFFEDNQFIILLTVNKKENIIMERCSTPCRCVIDHNHKKIVIELR